MPVYSARKWVKETAGMRYDRNWIVRQKVYNYNPVGMNAFGMNMRKPPFDDRRVRLAMAHLLDREKLISTLMYNQYTLLRSIYEDLYSPANPCTNTMIRFDPTRARELLAEAGWTPNPQTGVLEKDGRPFQFKFMSRDLRSEAMLVIYKEDLKKVGIEMVIERKDWSAWMKAMDEYNFEMTQTSYSGSLLKDPEAMWLSKEADRPAGANVTGFKDPVVDALIEKQKTLFDVEERHAICREIDARVCRQTPNILLWSIDYIRLIYWNKFGMPPHVLGKYGDERSVTAYWWYDPDADEILRDGITTARSIPPRPAVVRFDEVFRSPRGGEHTPGLD
jgi:microcin C transport system substrate-binding protein